MESNVIRIKRLIILAQPLRGFIRLIGSAYHPFVRKTILSLSTIFSRLTRMHLDFGTGFFNM